MINSFRKLLLGWLSLLSMSACANNLSWVTEHPTQIDFSRKSSGVPFVEIPASKLNLALDRLDDKPYKVINKEILEVYLSGMPVSMESKFIILARAVYANGGTGSFSVQQSSDALWVNHNSLGEGKDVKKTALVVFVDELPDFLYVTETGAE